MKHLPVVLVVTTALWLPAKSVFAEEASLSAQTVIKKKDGIRFSVPSDWPIEERNGAVGPIPIEEYLAKKFASLESRIRTLEQQISSFDLRLRVIEEEKKPQRSGGSLRSEESK